MRLARLTPVLAVLAAAPVHTQDGGFHLTGSPAPLWIQVEYGHHGEALLQPADGGRETPAHSLSAGLVYRFSDRRR